MASQPNDESAPAASVAETGALPLFHDESTAIAYLEELFWKDGTACPRCGSRHVSSKTAAGTWRCNACRRDFSVRTGTPFERSHVPLHKWLHAAYRVACSGGRVTSTQLGRDLGMRQATAWQVLRRLREEGDDRIRGLLAGFLSGGERPPRPERPIGRDAAAPVPRQVLAGRIYDGIRSGALRVNDRLLPEREIASQLGTGRGSVREALIVLETLGFIEVRGKEGVFVRSLTEEDCNRSLDVYSAWPTEMLPHTFQVRLLLESEAAGLASANRTAEDLRRMAGCVEGMDRVARERPPDWNSQGNHLNDLFHHQVIAAAHNPVLLRIHEGLLRIIKRAYATFGADTMVTPIEQWEERVVKAHRVIMEAIENRDEKTARELMRAHLVITFNKQNSLYRERIEGVLQHLRFE